MTNQELIELIKQLLAELRVTSSNNKALLSKAQEIVEFENLRLDK